MKTLQVDFLEFTICGALGWILQIKKQWCGLAQLLTEAEVESEVCYCEVEAEAKQYFET